jgi:hypothetical protein
MPNCDFYALHDDQIALLQFIFDETDCKIYELTSESNQDLRCFTKLDELAAAFDLGKGHKNFQLYSPTMKGSLKIVRTDWPATRREPASWRFETTGWGLIQLYLHGLRDGRISCSHTNHNTEKRAQNWEDAYFDRLGPASAWDFKAVTSISSKINRFIRKVAPAKFGPRPIMPAANQMVKKGNVELMPH